MKPIITNKEVHKVEQLKKKIKYAGIALIIISLFADLVNFTAGAILLILGVLSLVYSYYIKPEEYSNG
jgi:hypothetical protein